MQLLVKVTILFACALASATLLRRSRASVRQLPIASAFVALPAFVLAALVGPIVPVELTGAPISTAVADATGSAGASWWSSSLLSIIWLSGTVTVLLPTIVGLIQVRRLRRSGTSWPEVQAVARVCAAENGVTRPVEVVCCDNVCGPMTSGVRRPLIVLPAEARGWSDADVRRALLHEIEHVRRGDWPMQLFARVATAVFWFHPLLWMAWRTLRLTAEQASDDAVVAQENATGYAEQLVDLAARWSLRQSSTALAMAARGDLARRVTAVLDRHRARGRARPLHLAATTLGAVLVVIGIAPLEAIAPIAFELPEAPRLEAVRGPRSLEPPLVPFEFGSQLFVGRPAHAWLVRKVIHRLAAERDAPSSEAIAWARF